MELGATVIKDVLKRVNLRPAVGDDMKAGVPDSLRDQGMIELEAKAQDWDANAAPVVIDEVIMGNVLQAGLGQNLV